MNLKEYVEALNDVLNENPENGELMVLSASDSEGNYYRPVYYSPTIGNFESEDENFTPLENYEDLDEEDRITNAVCIN